MSSWNLERPTTDAGAELPFCKAVFLCVGGIQKTRDETKALELLRKAAQLQPDNRFACMDIASILVDQKNYPEALDTLRRAMKLNPTQSHAHFRMGHVYQLIGNTTAAEKEFAKVRELKKKEDEDLAAKVKKLPTLQNP